jgi:hypothetical protein
MSLQITPDPNEAEREAIRLALAAEEAEQHVVSEWAAAALLPTCEETEHDP